MLTRWGNRWFREHGWAFLLMRWAWPGQGWQGGMKASPNQWFSLAQGCRIAFVCAWLQHTPPRKGAYVAPEPTGGRFCYRRFGRFRVKPGMRQRRARNEGLGSILRQAQGPTKRPRRQSAAHRYPFEGTSRPPYVRHRPISALGAPQPWAQRTERAFPCGCLAERRADVTTRVARAK